MAPVWAVILDDHESLQWSKYFGAFAVASLGGSAKLSDVSEPAEETAQLVPAWPMDAASQAQVVNQAVCAWDQGNTETMYLVLGHVPPPLWLRGEDARRYIAENDTIDVQPRGSFVMSRRAAEEFWDILGRHLGKLPPDA